MNEDPLPLPWNMGAEQSVLGSILINPRAMEQVVEMLCPIDFYHEMHQHIFETMRSLYAAGEILEILTISEEIKKRNLDSSYLAVLMDSVPSATNIKSYAALVKEKSLLRQICLMGMSIADAAREAGQKAKTVIDEAEFAITRIVESRRTGTGWVAPADFIGAAIQQARMIARGERLPGRVESGIYDLDHMTGGFYPQRFYIFAARPGMGKTALGLQMALHAAKKGTPVGFFSLEMGKEDVGGRLLAIQSRQTFDCMVSGRIDPQRMDAHEQAAKDLAMLPFHLEESGGLKISEVRSRARTLARAGKLKILFVDYLGLILPDARAESQNIAIGQISAGLLAIAKELKIPVVALAQLNRAVELRTDKEPTMSDLRDSGNLEQDAWTITFIYREGYYKKGHGSTLPSEAKLLVRKNRSGRTGVADVLWQPAIGCFDNMSHREF